MPASPESAAKLRELVNSLPPENQLFLERLMWLNHQVRFDYFLVPIVTLSSQISLSSSVNKMKPSNLGIVWGPNFFRSSGATSSDKYKLYQNPINVLGETTLLNYL